MMHKKYILWPALALLAIVMACTNDDIVTLGTTPVTTHDNVYTYKLQLNMAYPGSTTRGEVNHNPKWPDGSTIEFNFTISDDNIVPATATYSDTEELWTVNTGSLVLPVTTEGRPCYLRFLKLDDKNETKVFRTPTYTGTSNYLVTEAAANDQSGSLTIDTLTLHPATWRLRFQGVTGTVLNFSSNDIQDDLGNKLTATLPLTVGDDGYTPYIYALFANTDGENTITVVTGGKTYHRTINGTDMKLGGSKVLNVPTESNYKTEKWELESAPDQHVAIDLGLPSGTLWANMNVGATTPEDYGYYFAWGEIEPNKNYYGTQGYKYINNNKLTKYCTSSKDGEVDNKTILDAEDDAAVVNWGGKWRTPTSYECEELINNCKWEWTALNDINGYLVSGNNGNSIFLPAAGYKSGYNSYWVSKYGCFLSSRKQTYLWFEKNKEEIKSKLLGYDGYSLRPVQNKENQEGDYLNISEQLPVFGFYGGSDKFTIDSNVSWKIHSNQTWCSVDKDQGQGKATITVNVTGGVQSDSTAILTITQVGGTLEKTIEVKYRYFEISAYSFELSYFSLEQELLPDKRNFNFWILSNVEWNVNSTVNWLHAEKTGSKGVSVIADNLAKEKREGKIVISADNLAPIIINVSDEVPALRVEPDSLVFGAEGNETKSLLVTCSRSDWGVVSVPWRWNYIINGNVVIITSSQNSYLEERENFVDFDCHGIKYKVKIKQEGKAFTPTIEEVSPNPLIFESNPTEGKTITVRSNMNIDPSVTKGNSWCHIESYTDEAITIKADRNTDLSSRDATVSISFKHDGNKIESREVTVRQYGASSINVTPFGDDNDWDK